MAIAIRSEAATRSIIILLSAATALAVVYFLKIDLGFRFLEKYPPDLSAVGLLRMAGSAIAAALFVAAITPPRKYVMPAAAVLPAGGKLLVSSSVALLATAGLLVAVAPQAVFGLVNEYAPAEFVAEGLLALSVLILLAAIPHARSRDAGRVGPFSGSLLIAAMTAIVFLILMEEISWGQKFLQWDTPDTFAANLQNETNLHNFQTHKFEFAFYSLAIFAFVVLPFAWPRKTPRSLAPVGFYVPPVWFVLAAVPLCRYMYEMWNIVPFQIYFFVAIFILAALAIDPRRLGAAGRMVALLMMALMLLVQSVFIANGGDMVRHHDLTEVRELVIAMMIFAYAIWLHRRLAPAAGN